MNKALLVATFTGSLIAAGLSFGSGALAQSTDCPQTDTFNNRQGRVPCPQVQPDYRRPPTQQPDFRRPPPDYRPEPPRADNDWQRRQREEEWRRRHRDRPVFIEPGPQIYIQPPVVYDPPQPVYGGGRWVPCARESGVCDVPYSTRVRFGRNGRYSYQDVDGPIRCSNRSFGDPAPGVRKKCDYLAE